MACSVTPGRRGPHGGGEYRTSRERSPPQTCGGSCKRYLAMSPSHAIGFMRAHVAPAKPERQQRSTVPMSGLPVSRSRRRPRSSLTAAKIEGSDVDRAQRQQRFRRSVSVAPGVTACRAHAGIAGQRAVGRDVGLCLARLLEAKAGRRVGGCPARQVGVVRARAGSVIALLPSREPLWPKSASTAAASNRRRPRSTAALDSPLDPTSMRGPPAGSSASGPCRVTAA